MNNVLCEGSRSASKKCTSDYFSNCPWKPNMSSEEHLACLVVFSPLFDMTAQTKTESFHLLTTLALEILISSIFVIIYLLQFITS